LQNTDIQDPDHFLILAICLSSNKNWAEALVYFEKAVELQPDYAGALINAGNCYYMLQDYEQAISTFKKVLEIRPDSQIANQNLGHLYGLIGNNEMQRFYDQRARGN